jgi:hypothetical protein
MNTNKLTPRGQIPREFGIGAPGFLYTLRFADHWMKRLGFDPRLTDTFQWAEYLQNANHLYWRVKSSVETDDIEPIIRSLETFGYTAEQATFQPCQLKFCARPYAELRSAPFNNGAAMTETNHDYLTATPSTILSFDLQLSFDLESPPLSGGAPLPAAALPLFASGLGALGLLGWRRKRKAAAALAAA